MPALSHILWITALWCTAANSRSFYWPETSVGSAEPISPHADSGRSHDLSTIFEKASQLESYVGKNDCFHRAAGAIRVHCGQLDMDEGERIKAAIEMTLCELATANHSPPLECVSLAVEAETAGDDSRPPLNSCVEALSRSAQYWSSYSGYLREVPQLCYAFRRWHDVDIARDTYRNATLEIISLLRVVHEQTEENRAVRSQLDDILQRTQRIFMDVNTSQTELMQTSTAIHDLTAHLTDQTATMFKESASLLFEQLDRNSRYAAQEMSTGIEETFKHHAAALAALVPDFRSAVQSELSHIISDAALQYQQFQLHAWDIEAEWGALSRNMVSMQDSVTMLITSASEAATNLAVYSSQAAVAQRTQQEVMHSAANLAVSLGELSNRTREEMHAINETAFAVREELVSAKQSYAAMFTPSWWSEWSNYGAMWLLQMTFGVDQPNLASFMQLPIVRFGGLFLHLAWYLLHASFSSVMSSALLILSFKRWFSTSVLLRSKPSSPPGTSGTVQLPPQTLVLPPSRLAASLPPRAAPLNHYDNGSQRRRFSRIPDRLLGPL